VTLIQLHCADLLATIDASRARIHALARRDDHGGWAPVLRCDPRTDPDDDWCGAVRPIVPGADGPWAVHDRSPASARLRLEHAGAIAAIFRVEITPGEVAIDLDAGAGSRLELALSRALTTPGDKLELAAPESHGPRTRLNATWPPSPLTMHLDVSGAARAITIDDTPTHCALVTLGNQDTSTRAVLRFTGA